MRFSIDDAEPEVSSGYGRAVGEWTRVRAGRDDDGGWGAKDCRRRLGRRAGDGNGRREESGRRRAAALREAGAVLPLRRRRLVMHVRVRTSGRGAVCAMNRAGMDDRKLQECRGKPEAPGSGQDAKQNRPAHVNEYDSVRADSPPRPVQSS
jgi:hypothetical protein